MLCTALKVRSSESPRFSTRHVICLDKVSETLVWRSLIQVNKNYNNFKHAVKRLDEVSLNARGEERSQALARWLGALKDLDRDYKQGQEKTGGEDGGSVGTEESEEAAAQQQSRVAMVGKPTSA